MWSPSLQMAQPCEYLRHRIRAPLIKSKAEQYLNGTRHWRSLIHGNGTERPLVQRRLWLMIPFGADWEMLLLHMVTLSNVTDGFIVSEARRAFMLKRKPAMLSEALQGGTLSQDLAAKTHAVVVDLQAAANYGHCSRRAAGRQFTRCLEDWQRYSLLRKLFELSSREDVAVLADADEISSPEVLHEITRCYPFPEHGEEGAVFGSNASSTEISTLGKIVLSASHYHYGLHCLVTERIFLSKQPWEHGPHVFAVSALANAFNSSGLHAIDGGPVVESKSDAARFSAGRSANKYSAPWLDRSAWHLSSFGRPEAIVDKYESWGHHDM